MFMSVVRVEFALYLYDNENVTAKIDQDAGSHSAFQRAVQAQISGSSNDLSTLVKVSLTISPASWLEIPPNLSVKRYPKAGTAAQVNFTCSPHEQAGSLK